MAESESFFFPTSTTISWRLFPTASEFWLQHIRQMSGSIRTITPAIKPPRPPLCKGYSTKNQETPGEQWASKNNVLSHCRHLNPNQCRRCVAENTHQARLDRQYKVPSLKGIECCPRVHPYRSDPLPSFRQDVRHWRQILLRKSTSDIYSATSGSTAAAVIKEISFSLLA